MSHRNDSIGPRLRKRERVACREGCLERLVQHFLPVQFFFICGPIRDLRAASLLLSIIRLRHELLPHSLPLYWMPQGMRIVRFSWQINARAISCRLSGEIPERIIPEIRPAVSIPMASGTPSFTTSFSHECEIVRLRK